MQTFSGLSYIKIDLANNFGLDRLNWIDRLHWVNDHRPDLRQDSELAENPILFRKALRALEDTEMGLPINFIMGLDATASGLQMLAAMSGCKDTAAMVNLIDTGNRECPYEHMANHMDNLLSTNFTRSELKKPVMTWAYGSEAVPEEVFGEGEVLDAFYKTLQDKMPGAYELMKIFQSLWDHRAKDYVWAMPDGHVVRVPVVQMQEKGLEIDEANHLRYTYRTKVNEPKSFAKALAANITHPVDAYVCRQMVKKARAGSVFLSPIHDCFYSHPNHMNRVRQWYRECVAEVAEMNLVENICSQIAGRHISFKKFSNNLAKDILNSEYALS